ncbi:MAG: hypothetical protein II453_19005 [Alphaproteobacteria bacterium]|nr:hypothetical protein [Alphaproteobacteria bacterium]
MIPAEIHVRINVSLLALGNAQDVEEIVPWDVKEDVPVVRIHAMKCVVITVLGNVRVVVLASARTHAQDVPMLARDVVQAVMAVVEMDVV